MAVEHQDPTELLTEGINAVNDYEKESFRDRMDLNREQWRQLWQRLENRQ